MIWETILTTVDATGRPHITPLGIREERGLTVLSPFRPSGTLDNVLATRVAVVNFTDDVRVFAGVLTGRRDWPVQPAQSVPCVRLANSLAHRELELVEVEDDEVRPRLFCRTVHEAGHGRFPGFNRARSAVIEAAILVSRLHMLAPEKIDAELAYLRIAIDKTAGPDELEAWGWLMQRIDAHRTGVSS
ncbi:MAG TPA: DUF447 domain-containing protein [Methyloversatilis sp.]